MCRGVSGGGGGRGKGETGQVRVRIRGGKGSKRVWGSRRMRECWERREKGKVDEVRGVKVTAREEIKAD